MTQSSPTTTPLSGPASAIGPGAEAIAYASLAETGSRKRRGIGRELADSFGLYAILSPTFILLAVFSLVPFVIAITTSFYDYEVGGESKLVGFSNYREYFHDYTFLESFRNMLFLTTFHVIAVMVMPLIVAKLIFSLSSERASYFYRILFLFPIVVPNVAIYLIWRGLIYGEAGLLSGHESEHAEYITNWRKRMGY